ncbi:MAG: phage integrase N-terminal SAM-like domain-containing protein [Candidatus Paceibacterota bacterium]
MMVPSGKPKLLDQVRNHCRVRHPALSTGKQLGTEKQSVPWIRRFILFHNKRHPLEMGKAEVGDFLFLSRSERPRAEPTMRGTARG